MKHIPFFFAFLFTFP
ncbi:pheA operon leader peptide PheL [Escherichia coli]|nr:pheA operon leader peptide PheL [Escherichia coli]MCD9184329.1 pheA operon leader peptide PheL [Escherichia coli]